MADEGDLVLVTGISGFLAKHVALRVARDGYRIRGTVRSASVAAQVRETLAANGVDPGRVEIVEADLLRDEGWAEAAAGCRFVLHVASPFPRRIPRDRFGLVAPARDGTLRVLRAARRAGAERVVLTSSVAAVYYGHSDHGDRSFTEADFTDVDDPSVGAYALSKTLAEKAAWNFASTERLELAVINPSVIFGPVLDADFGTSVDLVRSMLRGRLPLLADIRLGVVDVRDVADAHVRAMTVPAAAGHRFIASAGSLPLREIAQVVGASMPSGRWPRPHVVLPDTLVRLAAIILPEARQSLPELGAKKALVASRAKQILGVTFRSPETAIEATVESLLARGFA